MSYKIHLSEEQSWGILMVQGFVLTICLVVSLLALVRVGESNEPLAVAPLSDNAGTEYCDLTIVECPGEEKSIVQAHMATREVAQAPRKPQQVQPSKSTKISRMVKKNASKAMQAKVDYAWEISKDKDFVLMIEAESAFNEHAVNVNKDGSKDLGIMQINAKWHKKIVNDKNFKDWKWQIDQGYRLYKGGTTFYGYHVRHKVASRFEYK